MFFENEKNFKLLRSISSEIFFIHCIQSVIGTSGRLNWTAKIRMFLALNTVKTMHIYNIYQGHIHWGGW